MKEAADAQRLTDEDKKQLKNSTRMVVQMPTGCTAEDNCQWICDNMVGATGAKKESQYKGIDSSSTKKLRMLAEIKTEYTTSGGYEPDSDTNTEGFDTEFVETVEVLPPSNESKDKNNSVQVVIGALLIVVVSFIIIVMCVMKNKDSGATSGNTYAAPMP